MNAGGQTLMANGTASTAEAGAVFCTYLYAYCTCTSQYLAVLARGSQPGVQLATETPQNETWRITSSWLVTIALR